MLRSLLDSCVSVWVPYKKGDIEVLEKVQNHATKIIPEIRHLPYRDRLKVCKLPMLHYRQVRGDMIEMYKILTGKYDADVTRKATRVYGSTTRGNVLKLGKSRASRNNTCANHTLQSMICASIISLTGWLMLETVSMTMLYYLKQLTLLNRDLINYGNIKI